jgi:hypothetical protein
MWIEVEPQVAWPRAVLSLDFSNEGRAFGLRI